MDLILSAPSTIRYLVVSTFLMNSFSHLAIVPDMVTNALRGIGYVYALLAFCILLQFHFNFLKIQKGIFFFLICYAYFYFFSALNSADLLAGVWLFFNNAVMMIVLFYGLVFCFHRGMNPQSIVLIVYYAIVFQIGLSFAGGIGLIRFKYFDVSTNFWALSTSIGPEFIGVFANPNKMAYITAIGAVIALHQGIRDKLPVLHFSFYAFCCMLIAFSLARGGAALIISGSLVITFFFFKSKRVLLYFIGSLIAGMFLLMNIEFIVDLNTMADAFGDIQAASRTGEIWPAALQAGRENMFFGMGPNQFFYMSSHGSLQSAHNTYLQNFADIGIFGALSFVMLVMATVWQLFIMCLSSRGRARSESVLQLALAVMVAAGGLVESKFKGPASFFGLIFLIPMSWAAANVDFKRYSRWILRPIKIG